MTNMIDIPNTSVGPFRNRAGVRVVPGDGMTPNRLLLEGELGAARLMLTREAYGTYFDHLIKNHIYFLDEAIEKPWPIGGAAVERALRHAGLSVTMDAAAVERLEHAYAAVQARYSRWLPRHDDDGEVQWEHVPGTIDPESLRQSGEAFRELGWDRYLLPFALEAAIEAGTKRDTLLALSMGMTKTRTSLALAEKHRYAGNLPGPVVIVGMRRHLLSWFEEFQKVPLFKALYGEKPYEEVLTGKQLPQYDRPFLIISFERMRSMRKSSPEEWRRFQKVVEGSVIIVDEVYVASSRATQITQCLFDLWGAHHISLSGSPIRGYVEKMLPILQWTFRGGSLALPEYPVDRQGAQKRFMAKYVTYAATEGGRKRVPYVKNAQAFYDMVSPLICRRLRNEPPVIQDLGDLVAKHEYVEVELSGRHVATYQGILKMFREWYIRELAKREEGKTPPATDILAKLGYLVRAVSAPWRMADHSDEEFEWPTHEREITALLKAVVDRAEEEVEAGRQVIIFGVTRDPLELVAQELNARGVRAVPIHGGLDAASRDEVIRDFRRKNFDVLVGSYGVVAEGINLANASRVLLMEYDWSPSTVRQAIARITRPDQTETPVAVWFRAVGTIQDYQIRLASLKQEAMDAALDNVEQVSRGSDVPDIQAYAASLVYRDERDEVREREYFLEEVET